MEYRGYEITTRTNNDNEPTTQAFATKKGKQTIGSKSFSGSSATRRAIAHAKRQIEQATI